MAKQPRRRITNMDKYCIGKMVQDGSSIQEISKMIKMSVVAIKKHVNAAEKEFGVEQSDTVKPSSSKKIKSDKTHFGRRTGAKRISGVCVMTEAESARSEGVKGRDQSKIMKRHLKNIHKIASDDGEGEDGEE